MGEEGEGGKERTKRWLPVGDADGCAGRGFLNNELSDRAAFLKILLDVLYVSLYVCMYYSVSIIQLVCTAAANAP